MRSKILLLGGLVFLLTACSASTDVLSMTIKESNGTLPPEYQKESQAIITPDYDAETLDVSYLSQFVNDKTVDKYKKRLVVGDKALFESFADTVNLVKGEAKEEKEGCTGGDSYDVEIEEANGQFVEKSIYVCGGESPYTLLGDFYDSLQAELEK